jgi:hypothetical protein
MRTKLIAALLAGGCLIGYQATAFAQDSAEHPKVSTPTEAKDHPKAAAEYRDRSGATSNTDQMPGNPGPRDVGR